jgi:cytochrome c peroxidase
MTVERRAKNRAYVALAVVMALAVLQGCRRDLDMDISAGPTTPFLLDIPAWVTADGHLPYLPPDDPFTVEGVELGRMLFYEKALSNDYSLSCGSCHLQANAFTDPRPFSVGTDGSMGNRNAMAIMNMAWDNAFFWDGRSTSLEGQALLPVVDHAEMRNTWPVVVQRLQSDERYPKRFLQVYGTATIDSMLVVRAIAQFERTLLSFSSRYDRFEYGGDSLALTPQEIRGKDLFFREAHCGDCHMGPMLSDHSLRNNGLDLVHTDLGLGAVTGNAAHNGRFKTPTLRNIAVTAPYMHDSRFATLEEVVDFYADDVQLDSPFLDNHMFPWMSGQVVLSEQDRSDLVAFMRSLTDHTFLTDPAFSDPDR